MPSLRKQLLSASTTQACHRHGMPGVTFIGLLIKLGVPATWPSNVGPGNLPLPLALPLPLPSPFPWNRLAAFAFSLDPLAA